MECPHAAARGTRVGTMWREDYARDATMNAPLTAIEVTGPVDEGEWLRAAAYNLAFDFMHDTEEDIYSWNDGTAFVEEGEGLPHRTEPATSRESCPA